jgi:hypothetical protein
MARPVADDGVGWHWFDKLILWLLPPFLGYVGACVGGEGATSCIAAVVGLTAGIAVVRGIEAAINAHNASTPE